MFRLFLIEQLQYDKTKVPQSKLPTKQYRNRRLYERFNLDHKHLSLMNDQDILLIRDLSSGGFSCEVGERCFKRLNPGALYQCRIRYREEAYDLRARVSWKQSKFVGFSIVDPAQPLQAFFERLIEPVRIGSSLKKVDVSLQEKEQSRHALWFHGEGPSDLFIWENGDSEIKSWYFEYENTYIKWHRGDGVETGTLLPQEKPSLTAPWEKKRRKDDRVNPKVRQFAIDAFMVLDFDRSETVAESLSA